MTDDLAKYEALASGIPEIDDAVTELVAMVREARRDAANSIDRQFEWKKRAEAAERELAELKRKLREPDSGMFAELRVIYRMTWLSEVNHLLGD